MSKGIFLINIIAEMKLSSYYVVQDFGLSSETIALKHL